MFGRVTRRMTTATQFLNFNAQSLQRSKSNFFESRNQNIQTQHAKFREHHSKSYRTDFDARYSLGVAAGIFIFPFFLQSYKYKKEEAIDKAWRYFRRYKNSLHLYQTTEYIGLSPQYKDGTIDHYNNLLSAFKRIDHLDKLDLDLSIPNSGLDEDKKNRLRELLETFINNKNFKGINELSIMFIYSERDASILKELLPKLKINTLNIAFSRYDILRVKEEAPISTSRPGQY